MVKPIAANNQIECSAKTIERSETLDFLSSFKLIYYLLRVFGLWPFALVRDSNVEIQKYKIKRLDLLWFIISMPLYIAASIIFYKNSQFERENLKFTRKILNSGEYIRVTISLIFVALAIVIDMCNRFKLINVVNMFVRFDESVSVSIFGNSFLWRTSFIMFTHSGIIIGNWFRLQARISALFSALHGTNNRNHFCWIDVSQCSHNFKTSIMESPSKPLRICTSALFCIDCNFDVICRFSTQS